MRLVDASRAHDFHFHQTITGAAKAPYQPVDRDLFFRFQGIHPQARGCKKMSPTTR